MAIDVGSHVAGGSYVSSGYTCVCKYNVANATGLLFTIKLRSAINPMTGIKVASFSASGNVLTTRAYTSLANQVAAGETIYTAPTDFLPLEIKAGEYIGFYFSGGRSHSYYPVAESWLLSGDYIPCTDQDFGAPDTDNRVDIYGEGYELGKINIGDVHKDLINAYINIGDSWKPIDYGTVTNISDAWKNILS